MRVDSLRAVFVDDGDRRLVQRFGGAGRSRIYLTGEREHDQHQHQGVASLWWIA